jgi:PAS domain S-box-containing protein
MSWHWSGTSLLLLGGAVYLTACAVYVWRYRRGPTAASLVVVLAALAQWGVARAGALAAGDPAVKRAFCDLKYVGLVVLAPAAIVFVLQHAGRLRRPSPLLLGLLAVEPLVILVALAIPSTRHLFQTCLPSMAPSAAPMVRYGPLFWVHFVYFHAATWLCLAAFVVTMARTSRPYRRQNAILLGSLALPLGANLLTLLNFGPFGRADLPPFAFLLTVVLLGLAVFRFHLLDLRPIARSRIFQTIGEGVVVLDLGGKVVDANLAAERLLGQPVTRTVTQPAQRLAPAWTELVRRQRGNGGEAVEEIADNGHTHEVTVSSLTDHLGWPTGQLVVARDITERRRAERELRDSLEREQAASQQLRDSLAREQAASQQLRDSLEREQAASQQLRALDQMKGTFLQAVSHDLRTPLASVLGIAVTLQHHHQQLDAGDSVDLLQRLSKGAHKMDRLLNDLLDLDRLAQPTVSPERERVDLGELVERVVKDVRDELLDDRPLHVEVCPLRLEVDPPKVERIVENLLANAARYTPSGTPIWVRIRPHAQGALLIVEDGGPGVPAPLRETIFQPFRQGPRPASHAPGLGVGLALVRVFAQLHGGSAWVEERQGGGASFRVHLPDPSYGMR